MFTRNPDSPRRRVGPTVAIVLFIALLAAACEAAAVEPDSAAPAGGASIAPEQPTATVLPSGPAPPTAPRTAPPSTTTSTTSTTSTTLPPVTNGPPTTQITSPSPDTSVNTPVTVWGQASGVARIGRVTITVKDTGTGQYWNPETGEWQSEWLWYNADIASKNTPTSAWSFDFDPGGTIPSGLFQATAYAWDSRGEKDPVGSRIRFSALDENPNEWDLIWSDEFNGSSLDDRRWKAYDGSYGTPYRNQYYTTRSENVRVEDGKLILEAHEEPLNGQDYTSGMVVSNDSARPANTASRGNLAWTYGRFEVRAKVPDISGMWPAFWLRPADATYGSWPRSGEIDILEYSGPTPAGRTNPRGRFFVSGLHTWDPTGEAPSHKHEGPVWVDEVFDADFFDHFHTWAVEWEEGRFRWYIDGQLFDVADRDWQAPGAAFPAPFDQPFFITLNLQVEGYSGPVDLSQMPAQFEIDHVRVYG